MFGCTYCHEGRVVLVQGVVVGDARRDVLVVALGAVRLARRHVREDLAPIQRDPVTGTRLA